MTRRFSKTRKGAVGMTVVLASLGLGGAGAALIGSGTASAAGSTSTTKTAHPRLSLLRHTVDGTISVKTKNGYQTLDFARGTVGSISTTSITVDSPDGTSLTAAINGQTKFHNTTDQELQPGDKVGVIAEQGVAKLVNAPKSASSSTTPSTSS